MRIEPLQNAPAWPSQKLHTHTDLQRAADRYDRCRHAAVAAHHRGAAAGALAARVVAKPVFGPWEWLLGARGAVPRDAGALAQIAGAAGAGIGSLIGQPTAGRRVGMTVSEVLLELPRLLLECCRWAVGCVGAGVGAALGTLLLRRAAAVPEVCFPLVARADLVEPRRRGHFAPVPISETLRQLRIPCLRVFDTHYPNQGWLSRLAVGPRPVPEAGYNHALHRAAVQAAVACPPAVTQPLLDCNRDEEADWPGMGYAEAYGAGSRRLGYCRGAPTANGRIGLAVQYENAAAERGTLDLMFQMTDSLSALQYPDDVGQVRAALKSAMRLDWFEHLPDADLQAPPILATVAVERPTHLHVGHLGTNRALLCTPQGPVRLTVDHTLEEASEQKRVANAPASVRAAGLSRGLLTYTPRDGSAPRAQVTTMDLSQIQAGSALVLLPQRVATRLGDQEVNDFVQTQLGMFTEEQVADALVQSAKVRDANQSASYGALIWKLPATRPSDG